MEIRHFKFPSLINGKKKELVVKVPVKDDAVITNKYCPQELLTGGISFITAMNGESVDEFIFDCKAQLIAIEGSGIQKSVLDAHKVGLNAVVMSHIARCGRLIFGDLLIYLDCFSFLLEANGFSDKEIKLQYPRVARDIVEMYPDYIYNTADLSKFKGSHFDFILYNVSRN
ncbi:MAG: hypothetical protein K2L17_08060 [Muribaculaceae bacterium]|nr:hypothetical protein [Muribaculaceae bacterium]